MMFWRYLAFLTLLAGTVAQGAPKELPPTPPPPMAQSQNLSIFRGRSSEIPLRAVGRSPGQLRFIIRTRPAHGQLGDIRFTGPKSAVVTYTHEENAGAGSDSFTYAVQAADTAVSAPAPVTITISEEPPALSVVHSLDFGSLLLGEIREEEITIRNTGGGVLTGSIKAPEPWKILGSPDYRLGRKQEKKIRILFDPSDAGEFSNKLGFTHDTRSAVHLAGSAAAPLEFEPGQEIELTGETTGSLRSGSLLIRNRTPAERSVEISVPPEIVASEEVTIPARGEARLALHTQKDFLGALEGEIGVASEGFRRSIPLRVFALQAILRIEPEGLDFGVVQPGRRSKGVLRLKNEGGVDARLKVTTPPEILLLPDPNTAVLAPGERRIFEVAFESASLGDYRGEITISAGGSPASRIPVAAQINPANSAVNPTKIPTSVLAPTRSADPAATEPAAEEFPSDIPAIKEAQIDLSPKRDLEISWKKPAPNVTAYVIEQRQIEVVKDGPPKIVWQQQPRIKISHENDRGIARVKNLAPGQTWFFRISSLDEAGHRSPPSPTIRITTPPPARNGLMWILIVLLAAGVIALAIVLVRRHREALAAGDAERIARLGKP